MTDTDRDSQLAAAVSSGAVFGATGLLGRALCASLERAGVRVIRYSRGGRPGFAHWDPVKNELDFEPLIGVDAVVNLAGEGIADKRWTAERKDLLVSSRVQSTELLARTLAGLAVKPRVLVNASGVGYYGHRGEEAVFEDSSPGFGFLPDLCQAWEAATEPAALAGIRVVRARFGAVLTAEGGMLKKLLPIFRMGLGGRVASGEQYLPWITLPDTVSVIRFLIGANIAGPVNAVAPEATRNQHFTAVLAHALHRPAIVPVPAFALKTAYGELSQLMLEGANVRPRVLERAGFRFDYPRLEDALEGLLQSS